MEENELLECIMYNYKMLCDYKKYNKHYVYLIITDNNDFYVGKSSDLSIRIYSHINRHDWNVKHVYILESCEYKCDMDFMEIIWIVWYNINKNCINKELTTGYKIRLGHIYNRTIINTNYEKMLKHGVIKSFDLLNNRRNKAVSYDEYFGKYINNCKNNIKQQKRNTFMRITDDIMV